MVLYRHDVLALIAQALIRTVVDIDERLFRDRRIDRLRIDRIAVVLGRDVNTTVREVLHRMVATAVTILQLVGVRTGRKGHQLVAEADREDRGLGSVKLLDLFDDRHILLRVARTIRNHDAVRILAEDRLCAGIRRIHRDITAVPLQGADDVSLRTDVEERDALRLAVTGVAGAIRILRLCDIDLLRAGLLYDALDLVGLDALKECRHLFLMITVGGDHTVHGSFVTETLGQRSRIDACDARNLVLLQEILDGVLGAEIRRHARKLTHDEGIRPWLRGLHIFIADTVVTDQWIGHHDRLSCVGRVRQHFEVAGHRGVEYDLRDHFLLCTN